MVVDDGVVAGAEHAKDDQVQGIGGVVGEAEPVRIRAVEERRQHLARVVDDRSGLQAEVVARPAGVDPEIPVEVVHVGVDLFGFRKRCRPVVQVDQFAHR